MMETTVGRAASCSSRMALAVRRLPRSMGTTGPSGGRHTGWTAPGSGVRSAALGLVAPLEDEIANAQPWRRSAASEGVGAAEVEVGRHIDGSSITARGHSFQADAAGRRRRRTPDTSWAPAVPDGRPDAAPPSSRRSRA